MGRPFLYAQSVSVVSAEMQIDQRSSLLMYASRTQAYGAAGVVKIIRILERELIWGMRLLGVRRLEDLTPDMVRPFHGDTLSKKVLTSRNSLRRSNVSGSEDVIP